MSRNSTKISKSLVLKPQATPPSVPENNEIYNDSSDGLRRWDALTSTWSPIGSGAGEGINFLSNGKADLGLLGWVNYSDALPNTNTDVVGDTVDVQLNNDLSSVDSKGNLKSQARLRYVGSTPNGGMSLDTDYYAVPPVLGKGNQNPWTFGVSSTISGSAKNISSNAGQGNSRFLPYVPVSGGNGTFGTTSLDFSINTVDPLSGTQDFKLSKGAGSALGQGMSADFTIDRARLGKTLQISFDYKNSSAFATGDLAVYLYDRTNNVIIEPVGSTVLAHGLPSMSHVASFNSAYDSLDYRLIFHVASTNASAWDFEFDNVSVGPVIVSSQGVVTGRFNNSASQTGVNPNNSFVKLNINQVVFQSEGLLDAANNRLVVATPGTYDIDAIAFFNSTNILNLNYALHIYINGASAAQGGSNYPPTSGSLTPDCYSRFRLKAGDYVEFYLFGAGNNSSNTLTLGNIRVTLESVPTNNASPAYGTNVPAVFRLSSVTPSVAPSLNGNYIDVQWPNTPTINSLGFPFDGTNVTITKPGYYVANVTIPTSINRSSAGTAEYRINIATTAFEEYYIDSRQFYASGTIIYPGCIQTSPFYAAAGQKIKVRFTTSGVTAASYDYGSVGNFSLHEVPAPVTSLAPGKMKKYQTKTLPSDISTTTSPITSLGFNNLTVGKNYRVTMAGSFVSSANANMDFRATHNGIDVCRLMTVVEAGGSSDRNILTGSGRVFTATATTVSFSIAMNAAGILEGDGSTTETYVMLEECDDMIPTTDWN